MVVLDPGHNGGNGSHLDEINAQVPDGRGGHKACNTTGTSTDAGYTEHAFTFDVATRVRNLLQAKGFHVIMTRNDDSGVGPCVDQRAAIGNRAGAAAVVSIHADGAGSSGHGFHVNYSSPPLNSVQGQPSISLATDLRDVLQGNGFSPANYIGSDGLYGRSDLAGLNLSDRPSALVECGNMRNSADADVLSSDSGKQRIAAAIATAIEKYLS
ncbi:MAG: N-acetylmuramoyl-L-alanine amidase [Sciscionella sp.]|nr:N-acetylmuramoyl-L-alanine amidase [Sciscionella sp.]